MNLLLKLLRAARPGGTEGEPGANFLVDEFGVILTDDSGNFLVDA